MWTYWIIRARNWLSITFEVRMRKGRLKNFRRPFIINSNVTAFSDDIKLRLNVKRL